MVFQNLKPVYVEPSGSFESSIYLDLIDNAYSAPKTNALRTEHM